MNDTRRRWRTDGPPRRAAMRLTTWPADPTVGQLVLLEHASVPTGADVEAVIERARRRGLARLRTGALFPTAAAVLREAGFEPIDTLVLLRADLACTRPDSTRPDDVRSLPASTVVRPLRSWQHQHAARLDRLAFGPVWGYDAPAVAATRRATPAHHARRVGRRPMTGYAISGAGGLTGYVQRLAVHPDHRRLGIAAALLTDALDWMRSRDVESVLVNTGIDNAAALALYERHGFDRLPDLLTVAELPLDRRAGTGRTGGARAVGVPATVDRAPSTRERR